MELKGEYRIAAPREAVWAGLNDPEVLKASIPGCDEIEKVSETEMNAKVTAKVGPVKAKFGGSVTLSDLNPPESYVITGEGKGGAAGFAKGSARVELEADGDATILRYTVQANVGGKLAQIGARLIEGTARKMADDFFSRFAEQVAGSQAAAAPMVEPQVAAPADSVAQEQPVEPPADPGAAPAAPTATAAEALPAAPPPSAVPAAGGPREEGPQPAPDRSSPPRKPLPEVRTIPPTVWVIGLIVLLVLLVVIIT